MRSFALSTTLALIAALTGASIANADVSLNSVRVVAKDAEALASLCAAFGMHETNRLQTQTAARAVLNFGTTAEAAVVDPEGNSIELIQPPRPERTIA